MKDPVTALLNAATLSERAFREQYRYSKQFMVDVTAATYTRLPDSVHKSLRHLAEAKGVDVIGVLFENFTATTLDDAYAVYQSWARQQNRDTFVSKVPDQWTNELSPAHFFVKKTSGTPTRFSKDLKVPPQQVRRWVSGQTKTTPESIELALREINYPYVRELIEQQRAWIEANS